MTWGVVLLLVIVAFALAMRWFVNANPAAVARRLRLGAILLVLVAIGGMAILGRLHWLLGLIAPLAPILFAILARRAQRGRPADEWDGAAGQQSNVSTGYLDMTFDHDSGGLDGRVTEGRFSGRMLSDMSMEECRALLQEIVAAGDTESSNILTAYLDRTFGDQWHGGDRKSGKGGGNESQTSAGGGPMTREEAWRVLGLTTDATEDEIRSAHRRLMKQIHPDHGGSDYLASKINEAKDVLLGS